ncbi:MAG: hypothetical protein RIB47_05175 [Cyclobacteriaceae bacterium]
MKTLLLVCVSFWLSTISVAAQESDTAFDASALNELDSILTLEDSLSIFNMIDSLMQLPEVSFGSQLALRVGYSSNIASAERTLGIGQFGLSPGISYYHKSGAYLDVSGYWSKEFEPAYYLTIISAGYIGSINKWWSILPEYSKYLYSQDNDDIVVPYTNSLGMSNFFDVKPVTFRLDYNFFFGDQVAHRLMPGIMLNLNKSHWLGMDRVSFFPSFNVLFGSETTIEEVPYSTTLLGNLIRIRNGLDLFYEQEKTLFGVMNYGFSAPVTLRIKNWNFLLAYTYNIPKALPGEVLGLSNGGYLSSSITYTINFKK